MTETSSPINIYNDTDLIGLRKAGRAASRTLKEAGKQLREGISTADIDAFIRRDTRLRGGRPSQLGYQGFPAAVCTSLNAVACHGIPSRDVVLRRGDILNIDVTTHLGGFHGDTSCTFIIGGPAAASPEARHIVSVARRCRDVGIAAVRAGAHMGDIGAAITTLAEGEGCSVVPDIGGHGIGQRMHEAPHVPHVGRPGEGLILREGMVITIEPIINLGGPGVLTLGDGWTVVTADGCLSAQFEHTIAVTKRGVEVLTPVPAL